MSLRMFVYLLVLLLLVGFRGKSAKLHGDEIINHLTKNLISKELEVKGGGRKESYEWLNENASFFYVVVVR